MGLERVALAAAKEAPELARVAGRLLDEVGITASAATKVAPLESGVAKLGNALHEIPLKSGGEARRYDLFVPDGQKGSMPLVMVLDGVAGNTAGNMARQTLLHEAGAKEGFAVVYPYAAQNKFLVGKAHSWTTDDPSFGLLTPRTGARNDLNFLDDVMSDVNKRFNLDPTKVHGVGFSEGGWMVQHTHQRNGLFTGGISSIHGTTTRETLSALAAGKGGDNKADVLLILSQNDKMLPPTGGRGLMTALMPRAKGSEPMLQERVWNTINGSLPNPIVESTPIYNLTRWGSPSGHEVTQIQLLGRNAHHAWQGAEGGWPIVGMPLPRTTFSTTDRVVDQLRRSIARQSSVSELAAR